MDTPDFEQSFVLSEAEVNPIVRLNFGGKEKLVNGFGLWTILVSLLTGPIWSAAMYIVAIFHQLDESFDQDKSIYDKTGKIWSKAWLAMTMSTPSVAGEVERLKDGQGACLYVANHASWLDIPVLCTVLDPVFKFIAKGELGNVPCIGQQLRGGTHIMIDREDRKSQFLTFKEGLGWLKKGVPVMAFPEGRRSDDGRLIDFKKGIFSMAVKAGVPIVPLSLSNTHAVMPANSLFPVQPGAGKIHVHVHKRIDTTGLSEDEIASIVRETLLSKMPKNQHPLPELSAAFTSIGDDVTKIEGQNKSVIM